MNKVRPLGPLPRVTRCAALKAKIRISQMFRRSKRTYITHLPAETLYDMAAYLDSNAMLALYLTNNSHINSALEMYVQRQHAKFTIEELVMFYEACEMLYYLYVQNV